MSGPKRAITAPLDSITCALDGNEEVISMSMSDGYVELFSTLIEDGVSYEAICFHFNARVNEVEGDIFNDVLAIIEKEIDERYGIRLLSDDVERVSHMSS